jgi:hypothetical protein
MGSMLPPWRNTRPFIYWGTVPIKILFIKYEQNMKNIEISSFLSHVFIEYSLVL